MAISTKDKEIAKKIQPLGDRVLVKEVNAKASETTTKSGIIIPVSGHEDKSTKRGTVIAVGSGRVTEEGVAIALTVKVGDSVLYQWGDQIKIDGEEFVVVREGEIMAVIKG